jgi:putative FmdB family regulatory protein
MPTYQYRCQDCDYEFEEFQRISDEPVKTCPRCNGLPKRVITGGVGFVLKGSGFYSTDHRSESYKEGMKKDEVDSKPVVGSEKKTKKSTSGKKESPKAGSKDDKKK